MPTARAAPLTCMTEDGRDAAALARDDAKRALRASMRLRRAGCDPGLGAALLPVILGFLRPGLAVSGFWPIKGEIDIWPVLGAVAQTGGTVLLPVTPTPGARLRFRVLGDPGRLREGPFGTREPPEDWPEAEPRLLLVPLLAFDRAGHRLGYGGGFYDRTLAALRAAAPVIAIGCAFAAQEVNAVPVGPFDQRLDWIATERELIRAAPA